MVDDLMADNTAGRKACPRCGAEFVCGSVAGDSSCWCGVLPRLTFVDPAIPGCLCPACLKAALAAQGQDPASG